MSSVGTAIILIGVAIVVATGVVALLVAEGERKRVERELDTDDGGEQA